MFHNPKRLHRMSVWLKRISWLYIYWVALNIWIFIQSFLADGGYTLTSANFLPKWAIPAAYTSEILGPIFLLLGQFVLIRIFANIIQYLLGYYEQLTAQPEEV